MVVVETSSEGKPSMGKSIRKLSSVTRVGLELAKKVFQVHAVDTNGEIVVARKLARARLVGFSPSFRGVWRRWKRARRHIIGAAIAGDSASK
jgi:hypothetical protein